MHISTSPLDQFNIINYLTLTAYFLGILRLRLIISNIGLYMTISVIITLLLNIIATNYNKIISNNWSLSLESMYDTIHNIVKNQINANIGQIYLPFMYGLFLFILVINLIGMVPYNFASTTHFILTFSISFTVVVGATILAFYLHSLYFFSAFVPLGCPLGLLPLLVIIEFISYLARNVSLGLRLAANIVAGHLLLSILSAFTYTIMTSGLLLLLVALLPLAFLTGFTGLELAIAFIQAQVYLVLTCSYIKNGLYLH